ncbi:MAG: hypothetical protein M3429_01565 [Verrucomicrobiota bacterium]|nr:hypothetical protein [Chthoniobacterales bacterium]MDQ3545198.1 hypothetical protein [Verrucomicrobiota bacterium]
MPNDETLAHPEQPRFLLSAWMWAVVLFVFFGAIVAITFGTMNRGSTYEDARSKTRTEKLKAAHEEWDAKINKYGWVDKEKGVAHIPVRRAMELEMTALQAKKPAPAGPIATPAEDTPPVTATGAEQPANPPAAAPAPSQSPPATAVKGPGSAIGGQPAAAANPPDAVPGTQPGASATPAAAPDTQTEVPAASPTGTPILTPPGTPIPVTGATPTP